MSDLPLRGIPSPIPPAGDFGVEVIGGYAQLPRSVVDSLEGLAIRSAPELLAMAEAFPTAIAHALGWTLEDVRTARTKLVGALEGHLSHRLLFPESRPRPGMGARDPRGAG